MKSRKVFSAVILPLAVFLLRRGMSDTARDEITAEMKSRKVFSAVILPLAVLLLPGLALHPTGQGFHGHALQVSHRWKGVFIRVLIHALHEDVSHADAFV
jgi:uncharacterized membrane protein YqaE (UPF0057 family)